MSKHNKQKSNPLDGYGWALMIGADGTTGDRRIRVVNVESGKVYDPGPLGAHTGRGRFLLAVDALTKFVNTGDMDREALLNLEQVGRRVDGKGGGE